PTLDEGDFAMQMTLPAGSSLTQSIALSEAAEKALMDKFPEIKHVVSKIGTAEVPTDPMAVEDADVMIIMKPMKEWTSATTRAEMVDKMKQALEPITGAEFNFSQPIQLRFNELMTGAKADIAIKLYGEDMHELYSKAKEAAKFVEQVPGASDVLVEQTMGLPQLVIKYDRAKIARYGMNLQELNTLIRTAYAGEAAGVVFENERRFELVLRLDKDKVSDLNLDKLFVRTSDGIRIPMSEVATIELVDGPLQINRDATKRRIVIGVNVRGADIQQVVKNIQTTLEKNIQLKPGYYFTYGGQFENLQNAINTLLIVIPVALSLILLLLFFAFRSVTYTLVVFSTVPLSLIGGIVALWLRGLPFSISAGVGFIALFGVAVLNGILMINHFNEVRQKRKYAMSTNRIIAESCPHLLRPVFLTGLVASLGFVPMAIATSAGSEVQRPLATVVIGGLIVSTCLTLLIIPVFYRIVNSMVAWKRSAFLKRFLPMLFVCLMLVPAFGAKAQEAVTLDRAIDIALQNHPRLRTATAMIDRSKASRGEAWDVPATTVNYSWGQINGETRNDNQVEVTQSLGSLLTPFYKNALVSKQVVTGTFYREMVKKEITAEVKRAWAYYIYATHLRQLYTEQNELAGRLMQASKLRYEQGDITLLERNMAATMAADLRTRLMQAEEEVKTAGRRLTWACYADQDVIPADTALVLFPASLTEGQLSNSSLSDVHLGYFEGLANEKKAELRVELSRFFPEISLGYVRQKIAPVSGLNSWMVGVSFPILFFPQQSRTKQARISAYIAQTEADANRRDLINKVDEL
ncbi:MAG: efflux RND transporter permease subunit, partial [Tannerellaceae bacterium]